MLATIAKFFAMHAIAMLMLSVALRMPRALIHDVAEHWRVLGRALLVVWVAVPLFALAVLLALHPSPKVTAILMVLEICPGVPLVVTKSRRQKGDLTVTLLILMSTALTALVLVPIWSLILTHTTPLDVAVRVRDVAAVLAPSIIVPFLLGRIVVWSVPRFAAPLAKLANTLFAIGVAVIVIAAVTKLPVAAHDLGPREVFAALIIPAGAAVIGWFAARGSHAEKVSVGFAAAMGNPMLALAVLARSLTFDAVPYVVGIIVLRGIALLPFNIWFRRSHGVS